MRYISTRGRTPAMTFSESVIEGLAPDGGLLLPERIPQVGDRLDRWRGLSYAALAVEVMRPFVDVPDGDLSRLAVRSYASFDHPEVAPVVRVGGVHVLELFHGPTLAFKDIALQFLGNVFEYVLAKRGGRLNIVGATSGDTGSAAIHGVRGRAGIRIFMMHPRGRVSRTQELQMTSVLDENVFNLGIEGSFDDCQGILKEIFRDVVFKGRHALGAVNSINWARVLAQVVYYFHAALRVQAETGAARVRFAVPTGNFGDIFAGYVAARMGLPVSLLVLATNSNDILCRFFSTGLYERGGVRQTLSPSMDIQVASNFERYLYYRLGEDPARVREAMDGFGRSGKLRVPTADGGPVDPGIAAASVGDEETLAAIREFHARHGYVLDPHTAVGVQAAQRFLAPDEPMICLGTAHPAKFGVAILRATGRDDVGRHPAIDRLEGLPTRCDALAADTDAVRDYIAARAG
jgi:threonine synthase